MQKKLVQVEVLDWHDGIVLAVVQLSWRRGLFLASLVAWSLEEKRRALALIPVTKEQAEEFQLLASQDWDQFISRIQQLCRTVTGDVTVLSVDDTLDAVTGESDVAAAEIREEMISDMSDTLEPERRRWLGALPASKTPSE